MNPEFNIDVHRLYAVLSDILSEKYGAQITLTLHPKSERQQPTEGVSA